ncbi:MAG: GldG family protein [Spirochaetota bacterium]
MARKRSFDYSVLVVPLVVLGILVVLQLLSYRFFVRMDLTPSELHSLSEKTLNVLDRLDGSPLSATAFYTEDDRNRERARSLFEEYRERYRGFEYDIVDPSKNPRLVEEFEVGTNGTVVLEYAGRQTKVIGREEEAITNGIYRLVSDESRTIYFLTGHGEKAPDEEFSQLRDALEAENYEVEDLLLVRADEIPDEAAALVIGGPREELDDHELELVAEYFEGGGSLLVMLDPYRNTGLERFLDERGIGLRFDTIVDERSRMMGGDFLFPIVSDYGSHSITNSLDVVTFYPITRSLVVKEEQPSGLEVRSIAQSGPETWAEMDHETLSDGEARFDPEVDVRGPHTIAAAVTGDSGDSQREGSGGRMVVFGDSDFAGNDYLEVAGNEDIALSSIAWLTREETLIGIRSRNPAHTPVILTENESQSVFWLSIVLLPSLSALAGVVVWVLQRWRR